MGDVRACAYIFVLLLTCQQIAGKPFFGAMLCYLIMCDYDDDPRTSTSTTTASYDDWFDYDMCDCEPRPRRTTTPRPGQMPADISMAIQPSNGVNLTMSNANGQWQIRMSPLEGAAPAAPAAGAVPAPAPGAAAAPAAPAAAPAATTAAPTTPAAGK